MRLPRKFLKFDYWLHIFFGVLIVAAIVLLPISDGMSIWGLVYLIPLLVFWQSLSALILTLAYRNKMRIYYLLAVVAYAILNYIFNHYNYPLVGSQIFVLPILAVWYGVLTYKDATYRTPSFWDLEF